MPLKPPSAIITASINQKERKLMYEASDLKKGIKIELEGEPYIITDFEFSKPGKGQAIYRVRMKNLLTGYSIDKSYRSNDKFQPANVSNLKLQYSYFDGTNYVFMDPETFESYNVNAELMEDKKDYLMENMEVDGTLYNEMVIDVTLPSFVEMKVTRSDPGVKGDTATNATKPATMETGLEIKVPLFVNEGDVIRIDTRTGEYLARVSTK